VTVNESMILEGFPTGMFQENCFIAGCTETKEAMIVDPGDEPQKILAALKRSDLTAKLIVVTHEHIDHIGAVERCARRRRRRSRCTPSRTRAPQHRARRR
jgi:glyoxylase-like metal-dependent hydrolase (beta-lactamase superfamily II)